MLKKEAIFAYEKVIVSAEIASNLSLPLEFNPHEGCPKSENNNQKKKGK